MADREPLARHASVRFVSANNRIGRVFGSGRLPVMIGFAVVNASAAATGILMGRAVGTNEYGRYAVLASQVALFSVVAQLGTPLHILRSEGERHVFEAAVVAIRLVGVLGIVLAVVATVAMSLPVNAGVAIVLTSAAAVTNSFVPRLGGTRLAATSQAAAAVGLLIVVIVLVYIGRMSAERLVMLSAAAAFAVPLMFSSIRRLWARALTVPRVGGIAPHVRASLVLLLGNSLSSVALISLPVVAALRLNHDEVGFLRAALSISAILGGLASLLAAQQFLPQLVILRGHEGIRRRVWNLAREQLIFLGLVSLSFVVGVIALGDWFVRHTYGVEFAPVSSVLPAAALVETLKALVSVELGVLFAFGRLRQILAVEAVAAAIIGSAAVLSTVVFHTPLAVIAGVGGAYLLVGALAAIQVKRVLPRDPI